MTTVENITPIQAGTAQWTERLGRIAAGAKDRDLDDLNPFDQVAELKRAGFGALRCPRVWAAPGTRFRNCSMR